MQHANPFRRRLMPASLALPAVQGYATPLPAILGPVTTPGARSLLAESAPEPLTSWRIHGALTV